MISRRAVAKVHSGLKPSLNTTFPTRSLSTAPQTLEPSSTATPTRTCPHLRKVPSLPLVGSMIPQHSKIPKFELDKQYELNNTIRALYGNFMTMGFPGFGKGLHGTMYNIFDPHEMAKIVRSEGSNPSGAVEQLWLWRRALRDSESALISQKNDGTAQKYDYGLLDQGDGWKRQRTFLQTGMLDPRAARGFVPGIVAAAE